MDLWPLVGLGGDFLTFVGSFLVAWDAVMKKPEFLQIQRISKLVEDDLKGVVPEIDGIRVKSPADVQYLFVRRSARYAVRGCVLLAVGFLLLFVSRLIEVAGPAFAKK